MQVVLPSAKRPNRGSRRDDIARIDANPSAADAGILTRPPADRPVTAFAALDFELHVDVFIRLTLEFNFRPRPWNHINSLGKSL
jgi:hypothetical protein